MLTLVTKSKSFDFKIDKETYHLPLSPTVADMKRAGIPDEKSEDPMEMVDWFCKFAVVYVPVIESLSMEALSQIMNGWREAQEVNGEADMGES